MIGALFYNKLTSHLLANMGSVSLVPRALARMDTIPEDRQADYTFRDIYLGMLNTLTSTWMFRLMESAYMVPKMVQLLGLHNLGGEYQGVVGARDYKSLPRILEHRMLGYLVNEQSFYAIGNLLKNTDSKKFKPGSKEQQEVLLLAEQLERRLNQNGYLKAYYGFNDKQVNAFDKVMTTLGDKGAAHFKLTANGLTKAPDATTREVLEKAIAPHESQLAEAFGNNWQERMFSHTQRLSNKTAQELLHDAATSRSVQDLVRYTRKTGAWANLLAGVGMVFVTMGLMGTWFDFNILQPWQKKLAEQRGTTREVVLPQVWAFAPGSAAAVAMHYLTKPIPGYATRFITTFGTGFLVYTGSLLFFIKQRLSKPPQGKYALLAEQSKKAHAQHHEIAQHANGPAKQTFSRTTNHDINPNPHTIGIKGLNPFAAQNFKKREAIGE